MKASVSPVISIITPSFNQGRYIDDTIKSVIFQKGDFYIDYIIMDGKSHDETVSVIKKYETLLSEITEKIHYRDQVFHQAKSNTRSIIKCKGVSYRWWSKKDEGQSDAINQAARLAVGDWVGWLCSDDWLIEGALEKLMLNTGNADVLYGDVLCLQGGKFIPAIGTESYENGKFAGERMIVQQPGSLIRMELWRAIGGLDESLNWTMDYDLFMRIESQSDRFTRVRSFVSVARIYPEAKTSSGSLLRLFEYIRILLRAHLRTKSYFSIKPYAVYGLEFIIKFLESKSILRGIIRRMFHTLFWKIARPREREEILRRFDLFKLENDINGL